MTLIFFVPDRTDPKLTDISGTFPETSAVFGSDPSVRE